VEVEEVDRGITSILKREEEKQPDSPLWINGKLGNPPDTRSPKGAARERGAGQNPKIHPHKGERLEEVLSCGVGSSSRESADEG
jgi:hypothetical protein